MNIPAEYKGMRWYKCDLHMHTPADKGHWRGSCIKDNPKCEAEEYIRICYEEGLECIAITDHNFRSKEFIPYLAEAINTFKDGYGYEVILFPGFEITADVGRGIHVIALFDPNIPLENIDHILTNCGIPMPRQKAGGGHEPSTKRLEDIIEVVQNKNKHDDLTGIVICPHLNENGLFDNDRISEWLQQSEWQNPELYAVEVPKPVYKMSNGWQRLFKNGSDCDPNWRRIRPMAAVMSSDCKSLDKDEDDSSYIGKRYCWIKMSEPSVEALRQAFLDPDSRICLEPEPPAVKHTYIHRMSIKNTKFLEDQEIVFSPHLNCFIGGRGSGKSMLFESMRIGLRGDVIFGDAVFKDKSDSDSAAVKQVKRLLRENIDKLDTQIVLDVKSGDSGLEDRFVMDSSKEYAQIISRKVENEPIVFQNLKSIIFSQEEITELANRQKTLLEFIDSLAREKLEPCRQQARRVTEDIKSATQQIEKLKRIDDELIRFKQEVTELSRQLEAKTKVQEELKKHRAAQDADIYLESVKAKAQDTEQRLLNMAEELETEPPPLGSRSDTFPESDFFIRAETNISAAYSDLAKNIRSAVETFHAHIDQTFIRHPDWDTVRTAIKQAEERFKNACNEKGLTTQEAEQLKETEQQQRIKQAAMMSKQHERDELTKQLPDINELYRQLSKCWFQETEGRRHLLNEIVSSDTMPLTENGKSIVKTSLIYSGNREAFLEAWRQLAPKRSTTVGRIWDNYDSSIGKDNIGEQLFDNFQKEIQETSKDLPGNPIQWLEQNIDDPKKLPPRVSQYLDDIKAVREKNSDKWTELLLTRVPDAADLTLLRNDASPAGSFMKGDLSTGQKNTAILSLLLALGNGPVLIDQPEDELDSQFLFRELVPMFRKSKMRRQLIIVTHNANIPVNADAELVYALEARGGRGVCKAQGGLDMKEVTKEVLEIMEGSEEAFRRRKEKYHF